MQEGSIHRNCEFLSQQPLISTHITNQRTAWLTYYAPGRLRNKMGRDICMKRCDKTILLSDGRAMDTS